MKRVHVGEHLMELGLRALKIPYEREFKFARDLAGNPKTGIRLALKKLDLSDWRFDFALLEPRIAIEVEGGVFTGGRHTRGAGYSEDCKKYNMATLYGWRVLRFTTQQVRSGEALKIIEQAITHDRVGRV